MSTISIEILESIISLEHELDDILTSILLIKSGAIHPSIISTERLYKELLASSHTRTDKSLVAPVMLPNIHQILESSTVTSYAYMNKLIYILQFPLIRNDKFKLYHLYSIPIQHPDSSIYSAILPEQTYMATSTTLQQYVTFNSLQDCKTYAPGKRVCGKLPVYNYNTRPTCEMAILLSSNKELPSICEITTFAAHINTFQHLQNNKWIYILKHKTPCVLQCKNGTTHQELEGTGIISLEQGCKIYTGFVTLSATDESTTNISHPIITVDIENDCRISDDTPEPPELLHIKLNNIQLDSLHTIKDELKKYSEQLENNNKSFASKHINKISTLSYIIGALLLAYMLYKIYQCCPRRRSLQSRRPDDHQPGCIQIFNNCFSRSKPGQRVSLQLATSQPTSTSCISDDEDTEPGTSTQRQKSGKIAQSLF